MTNNKAEHWPPPPEPDPKAFERVTEGQRTILGTGGKPPQEKPIPSAPAEGE